MKIVGTGSCLPQRVVSNDDLAAIMDTSDEWISSRTACLRKASSIIWLKKFILKFIVILSKNSAIIITIYFL